MGPAVRGENRSYSSAPRGGRSARFFARVARIYIRWNVVTMDQQLETFGTPDGASSSTTTSSAPKLPTR